MGKQISLREAYEKVKKDSGNAPNNRLIALEKSIADYGSGWHSKEDSVALNKKLHFEKMRATAQSNDELLKKLNEISGSVVDQSNLYSQYKDADDYNKAKRKYQLDTKYGRLKTHEDYEKYYKSGNFEQANLPQDEKDYLLRLGYKLEYREAMSSLNVAKQRLEGLPKNITTNSPYNEQQRIKIQQEKKILEANIKKLESRIKEMDNMGGIYTGLNTEILSESGEYAFDQRWANKKAEMEEQNETTSEKDRIRKMAGLPTTEEERQKETLTDKEKIKLMSGQKVDKSDYYIDDIFKNAQPYQYLYYATDDEKRLYSFIKKRDGEGLAQKYLEDLKIAKLDKRLNQAQFKEAYDYSAQNGGTGFLGSLASIPTNLFSGIEYGAYRMAGLDGVRSTLASKSQGFREGTKSQIDSDVWDFVYDTTMSGLDSAAAVGFSAVAPWLGEVVLASSVAASTYNDALDRGISHGDALLTSLAAGVAESLFEHISIGKFLDGSDITKGFTKAGLRQAGKNILIEMGINASEEALTEVSNIITDTLINGNLSNYAIAVKDYYMQGMTPEEAKKTALADFGKQIVEAGASGLLMGFGFGTIGSVKGMAKSQISNSRNGGMVKANGNINELKIMANLSGVGEIKTVAEKLSEISKPSEIGYVYNRLVENAVESSVKQMTPILLENGAKEGGSNSAKARALQIAQSVFKKKDSNIANLMRNRVTSDVYTAFAKEGKYGGDMLLALKELASNPQPKAMTANDFVNSYGGEGPAVSGEIKGIASAPRTGTIHPITEAFGKSVAENLERQRPTPQRPKTKKITKTGEAVVKAIGKAMGVEVEFTDSAVDGVADGKTVDHKKVYISRYTVDPIKEVIKHEFTHTTEISKHYGKFQKYLFDESEAFKVWLKSKDYTKWPEMETDIIDLYKQNGETLGHEGAKTEIVAKFVSENLFKDSGTEVTETFLKELYLKDRNLFDRFVDWVKSVFARLKASGAVNKDIIKLEQKFIRLAETAKKQRTKDEGKSSDNTSGETQYLFVGPKSLTADRLQLATAKDWLKKGIDSETIRKETGWFKGYDGKWRFEISDKDAVFDYKKFTRDMITQISFEDAREKVREGVISGAEFAEEAKKYFEAALDNRTLKDYVNHEKLFEAYPELKDVSVVIRSLDKTSIGTFNSRGMVLTLNLNYCLAFTGDKKILKETIIHEIQHAVQDIEGFTRGASGVYWQMRKNSGEVFLDENGNEISNRDLYLRTAGEVEAIDAEGRIKMTDKERKNARPDIDRKDVVFANKELVSASNNAQYSIPSDHNYVYTNGKASFTEERLNNLFDEHSLGNGKRAEHSNAYVGYISPEDFVNLTSNKNIRSRIEDEAYVLNEEELRNETETPFIEYDPASGEVVNHEGRHRMVALKADGIESVAVVIKPSTDSFERRTPQDISLTGQNFAGGKASGNVTVKNAIPLSEKYRTEAVTQFAKNPDADVRYSIPDVGIKQQLKDNLEKLNSMETVATLNEQKTFTSKQDVAEWALSKFEKIGFKVYRNDFGEIILDKKRIKKGLSYLKTNEERLALALLPDVLSKGIEIGSHANHKGRNYNTFTFAAPISINGQRGNMAVVVRREDKNYYKVHRLVMPDGSQFVLDEKRDTAETAGGVDNNSGLSPTDNVSKISISDSNEKVKTKLEERVTGDDLLNAQDLIEEIKSVGGEVDENGYVTVYHRTTENAKEKILSTGKMTAKEDGVFFSTKPNGQVEGYGSAIIKMSIPVEKLILDDIFNDEAHLRYPLKTSKATLNISEYINNITTEGKGQYSLPDIDRYTEKQYNDFGWVRANDVLTAAEYSDLLSNYTGHKHTKDNYQITRFGETVIYSAQYTDVLMYVKGPINNPQITKVVRIVHDESWAIPFIKEEILKNEREQNYQPFKTVEGYFGQRVLDISKARDYASYREYRDELERNSSTKSDTASGTEQDGKGSTKQNKETSRADSLDGSVSSLPEKDNTQYSIPNIAKGKTAPELWEMSQKGEITSDDALKVLAEQYGTMSKGENPKVDVTLPEQISKTKNVNQFMRNVLESGHLDADMSETEKRNIISGARTYKPISDKAALSRAESKIKTDVNGAVQEWENIINSGKRLTKFDVALGEQLLVQAADTGNANDVTKYIAELADIGTQSGQVTQALRLLKQMTGIGQLYYVTRTVARLNKDIEARYGEKHKIVEIDPHLAKILANSKSESEIDAVVEDLIKDVASQVKSSWVDKFNSWRYLAMLGNPRTHVRNVVGNGVFLPAVGTKNKIAALAEKVFIDKENRTKTFGLLKPEYRAFATKDFEKVEDIIKGGGKMNPTDQIRDQMKVYNSKAFAWLEKARQFNFDMLEKEDGWFLKGHYIRALGGAMQARGLDVKNVTPAQLEELRTYAIKEAQKATYRDVSQFAQTLNKLAHPGKDASIVSKAAGVAVEGLLPFKKTPINILKRGIEYSPVGIATSIVDAFISARKGEFSGAQLIDGLSAGLTGTGIMLLGALCWSLGFISGGMDYDDEDALERMAGKQPYAINFGNFTYTIDFAAPAVLPFMIGAETAKIFSGEGNDEALGFFDAVAAIGAPMTELSMLQGLNDAIETIAYSENKMGDFTTNIFASYFSQYVPTLGGQIARTFDDTRRTNFIDKDSAFPKIIQTTYQKALGKIPYFENKKVPYIDAWGRTEENDNILLRAFENFISPGYVSTVKDDKVNGELAKIFVDTGESGVIPKRAKTSFEVDGKTVNLSADEYVRYATDKGQYSRQYLEEVMSNPMYQGLSSEGKAAVISDLYSFANAKAKSNVSDYDYTTNNYYKTAAKLEAAGISPASYYIAREAMSKENADKDGSGTVSGSEKKKALRKAGFNSKDINTILNINK